MPSIPPTMESTKATTLGITTNFLKRSSLSDPSKYPLWVFLIIVGCIVGGLIGFSVWTMYHGLDDSNTFKDVSFEQRKYMREARQRNLNGLAVEARRPDMIIPIDQLNW
ncbi:hypothetical protein N7499_002643 [Penicillium canescens]|uniref:Uncharacterized protein n=1 Tax=Penicillium canescens TaxID=5083 RepID=A0AAD6I7U2_PENCN|nr:uncharacterized protein N7446_010255 [Penicillium canescens]KAJ6001442.1 hypothetical protein N7522_006669 [Penicillium canescens]KAJ6035492.1 hypothetical protein N7460_009667 [Penicillium canescens]KAJ6037615.1 hypothetical protein N7444_010320 [Penicillium canescens]KAJ6054243.1 hypothetical protein N7446_010255 [Penicillium canescens]KAJ6098269.1 hypothetical protein N7499_002643 [Penicillium canescens]